MTRADEQLHRLLHVFPLMADEPHLTLEKLAERVGSDAATLRRDFAALDRDDVPGGWVEAIEVHIGPQAVSLRSAHFKRPMRLTRPELAALELGLGMLAQEVPADEQRTIADVRTKLQKVAAPRVETAAGRRTATRDGAVASTSEASHAIGVESARDVELERLAVLHHALEHTTAVELNYHRPDEDAPTIRRVQPYAMVRADANIYIVGFCERAQGIRVFRLDRVVTAEPTSETFVIPGSFSVESVLQQGRVFSQDDEISEQLVVRYGPAVARWVAEREQASLESDRSVTVRYPLADAAWAMRHVLQYGPDAVILSPASVRADVELALRAMLG